MTNYTNDCDPIMYHLAKIVDMYLDVEQKHYEEAISNNETVHHHIYQSLLAVSHWIKENHTMLDIDEDVSAEIQMLKEKWNE